MLRNTHLEAFSAFIQANKEKIEAISILFKNPRKWNTQALREIRQELRKNSFDEDKVRKAHELAGHKALADIISMVKNADSEQNPLLTAEERVNNAMADIIATHQFNTEQKEWLEYIRQHLIINLAIERDNFDLVPVLERHGGLSKAKRIFGDELDSIIEEINYKLAA
jgi:type I restriction enzyme, R subunit